MVKESYILLLIMTSLAAQVPLIKKKFLLNKDYAKATAEDIFPDNKDLQVLTCNETQKLLD